MKQVNTLPGDSSDYHLLTKGVELSKDVAGMTCEIGLRLGGGTKYIVDALAEHCPGKVHIALDPYGHIEYNNKEGSICRLDYTNEMRDTCLGNLYPYVAAKGIHFLFFNLEDTEFFRRYADGVPVYRLEKTLETKYSFIHFDGPHALAPLQEELSFFIPRAAKGAVFAFDDLSYYDHSIIENLLFEAGFVLIEKTFHKGIYRYEN